jgi:hypothetical protein
MNKWFAIISLFAAPLPANAAWTVFATTNWSTIDGSANAPAGVAPQMPNILNGLTRPPWKVAGVDYGVGYPAGTVFKDPEVAALPACASVNTSSHVVTVTGSAACTFDSWDFSLHNGGQINIADAFTGTLVIKNSKFAVGSNGLSPITSSLAQPTEIDITYNTFDGGGTIATGIGIMALPGGKIVIQYNYVSNWNNDVFRLSGVGGVFGGAYNNYTIKYNAINSGVFGSTCANNGFQHPDQLHSVNGANQIIWQFNTSYQPSPTDLVRGFPGNVNSFLRSSDVGLGTTESLKNVEYGWNVWTGGSATAHALCSNTATGTTTTSGPPDVTSINTLSTAGNLGDGITSIPGAAAYGTNIPQPGGLYTTVSSYVSSATGSLSLANRATGNGSGIAITLWAPNVQAIGNIIQMGGTTAQPLQALIVHDNYFNYGGNTPTITGAFIQTCVVSNCTWSQSITNNVNMFNGATIP